MAITAQPVTYSGQGPAYAGEVLVQSPNSGNFAQSLVGTAQFTGDGSLAAATLNYIDGTAALSFTPSAVLCTRIGGSATATIGVASVVDAGNGVSATVNFTSAPGNAATFKIAFMILK